MNEELFSKEDFVKWYSKQDVLFEIVKQLKGRELRMIGKGVPTIPYLKAHSLKFLKWFFDQYKFFERQYNLYRSVAYVENLPVLHLIEKQRYNQQRESIRNNFKDYVMNYDLVFDFDKNAIVEESDYKELYNNLKHIDTIESGKKKLYVIKIPFNRIKKECGKVRELLNEFEIPYCTKTSGSGFHIEIGFDKFKLNKNIENRLKSFKSLAGLIKGNLDLLSMDNSIYNLTRVWKIAYTIDIKTGNVSIPLSNEQFENIESFNQFHVSKLLNQSFYKKGMLYQEGKKESIQNILNEMRL